MRIAVVGVTGLVGTVMNKVLEERGFPVTEYLPVASERSVGKEVVFQGVTHRVIGLEEAVERRPDIAIFSAGGSVSLEWAPRFAAVGTTVIDNSSAWRMDPAIPLVVPEINASLLGTNDRIIANPNCSTIQMVMVLAPLHRAFGLDRVVVSTYQSITGTGVRAVRQYEMERKDFPLEADQFFMLGDNSSASKDSRAWGTPEAPLHHVDRRLLIGRALVVFWPHAVPTAWNRTVVERCGWELRLPCLPNFARMRFVK